MEDPNYRSYLGLMLKGLALTASKPAERFVLTSAPIVIGPTPQLLVDLGLPPLDLFITGGIVSKAFYDHGITKAQLERLYELLSKPKGVYKSTVNVNTVVVTFEVKNSAPIIVPIAPNGKYGRGKRGNHIASMYDKTVGAREAPIEEQWKAKGLLLWEPTLAPVVQITTKTGTDDA